MPALSCNAEFPDEAAQKLHYRSDWHQYNLRRKVAGVPGVTEALFNLRLEALAAEKKKLDGEQLLYKCFVCEKEYRSSKAHAQHLRSKLHVQKASGLPNPSIDEITVTRPAPSRPMHLQLDQNDSGKVVTQLSDLSGRTNASGDEDSSDDWEEIQDHEMSDGSHDIDGKEDDTVSLSDEDMDVWDASQCFICDLRPDGTIEGCLEHMHKMHGFFIPDAEYLKDPRGLLSYLGLKVTKDFTCLYCDDRGKGFQSLEAVRKHMISKSHCKLRFGEEGIGEDLEEFYDFSSSYLSEDASQIMSVDGTLTAPVSLSAGGSELVLRGNRNVKILGSREFLRYYKQRPRPADRRDGIVVNALVARYRSLGLATKQSPNRVSTHC